MSEKRTPEQIMHAWQDFRMRCLKLALKCGATEQNALEIADKFGAYIITKSDIEKRQEQAAE